MPAPELDLHGTHWVNAIGHCIGVILFANLGWLLYRDARRIGQGVRKLPLLSTMLALAFDLFLFLALAVRESQPVVANAFGAMAFASLSLLPAVLLDIAQRGEHNWVRALGYAVGLACALLHGSELIIGNFMGNATTHAVALAALSIGFALLALANAAVWRTRVEAPRWASVCLFLLAISFLHFLSEEHESGFWAELVLHHAGIPAALFVILQDYRFLLLDAFLRLTVNGLLAIGTVGLLWRLWPWLDAVRKIESANSFEVGMALVSLGGTLLVFALVREKIQLWITRQVFLRPDPNKLETELARLHGDEAQILREGSRKIANYFRADSWSLADRKKLGYEASVRIPFLKGDEQYLHLSGRRFLSEDLDTLEQFAGLMGREVDRSRAQEMERLVVAAELRALQSQIHPHFLFNALNALYGSIPRQAADARRLVLSLSEVFRYFLTTAKPTVRLDEEIRIVEAYLDIEKARLGPRLSVSIEIDEAAAEMEVPVLIIQPLVENAIKHGVAALPGPGKVRLLARLQGESLVVEIDDSGPGWNSIDQSNTDQSSNRIGLENVRRRLDLHYGDKASLRFEDIGPGTRVQLEIPVGGQYVATQDSFRITRGNSVS